MRMLEHVPAHWQPSECSSAHKGPCDILWPASTASAANWLIVRAHWCTSRALSFHLDFFGSLSMPTRWCERKLGGFCYYHVFGEVAVMPYCTIFGSLFWTPMGWPHMRHGSPQNILLSLVFTALCVRLSFVLEIRGPSKYLEVGKEQDGLRRSRVVLSLTNGQNLWVSLYDITNWLTCPKSAASNIFQSSRIHWWVKFM